MTRISDLPFHDRALTRGEVREVTERADRLQLADPNDAWQQASAEFILERRANTATITGIELAADGVLLVKATHRSCGKTVLHGAGVNPDALLLGHRTAHCRCPGGYALTDSDGVLALLLPAIREELARREGVRTARAARMDRGGVR